MFSFISSGDSEAWNVSPATMSLDRYHEYSSPIAKGLTALSASGKNELRRHPALLAYEIGAGPVARVAWIIDMTWSAKQIQFEFEIDPAIAPIDLEQFYGAAEHFGIESMERYRTHWAVKDVNLPDALYVARFISAIQRDTLSTHLVKRTYFGPEIPTAIPVGATSPFPHTSGPTSLSGTAGALPNVHGVAGESQWSGDSFLAPAGPMRPVAASVKGALDDASGPKSKVFLVHGHDEALKYEAALVLKTLGVDPIILHQQGNGGQTIIEKFERHAGQAHYAVVLLSPDDVGGLDDRSLRPRARQNVILELGYFAGKLGRSKVCALQKNDMKKGEIELPSDWQGILWLDASQDDWRVKLAKELMEAGIKINATGLLQL